MPNSARVLTEKKKKKSRVVPLLMQIHYADRDMSVFVRIVRTFVIKPHKKMTSSERASSGMFYLIKAQEKLILAL